MKYLLFLEKRLNRKICNNDIYSSYNLQKRFLLKLKYIKLLDLKNKYDALLSSYKISYFKNVKERKTKCFKTLSNVVVPDEFIEITTLGERHSLPIINSKLPTKEFISDIEACIRKFTVELKEKCRKSL